MCALGHAGGWLPQRAGLTARLCGALLVACGVWTAIVPVAILSGSQAHQRHNADGRI
jgi:hypothetical protein